jgi:hypothetical protein
MYVVHVCGTTYIQYCETLGLSMELNDDILVQTTSRKLLLALSELNVSCFTKYIVAYIHVKDARPASFASICLYMYDRVALPKGTNQNLSMRSL